MCSNCGKRAGTTQILWHISCKLSFQEGALPQCPLLLVSVGWERHSQISLAALKYLCVLEFTYFDHIKSLLGEYLNVWLTKFSLHWKPFQKSIKKIVRKKVKACSSSVSIAQLPVLLQPEVSWNESYSFMWGKPQTHGLFQTAAVLSTDAIHWCWINAPTLNQCSHKYCVISFLCLRHWYLFWKTEFFQLFMAPLKHNIPCYLGSRAEVSQSCSSPEVAANVQAPARSAHTPVGTHPAFTLFRKEKDHVH